MSLNQIIHFHENQSCSFRKTSLYMEVYLTDEVYSKKLERINEHTKHYAVVIQPRNYSIIASDSSHLF